MPELPDVELFRRYFESEALHNRIEKVDVVDASLIQGKDGKEFSQAVAGQTFQRGRRHGKFLFGELSGGGAVGFHFGMTGFLQAYEDPEEAPGHVRMAFLFRNGRRLAYDCQRKFGHVGLVGEIDAFLAGQKLGPDALEIDFETFSSALAGRKRSVKADLMDQSRLAGLGNVYSDETLFQARLRPEKPMAERQETELRQLYQAMSEVLQTAIDQGADPEKMPADWLISHRGSKSCPRCGGELNKKKVGGRSTWFCSTCQTK